MGFFALLGYISKLDISQVEEISGASAGAILGMFLCQGTPCEEILKICLSINIESLVKPNLLSIITNYGLTPLESVKNKLFEFFGNITFSDVFKKYKKKLYISSFCVDTGSTEYFSVDTHPDMIVVQAITMSISVPILFEPVMFNGNYYVDGGLIEKSPMKPLPKEGSLGLTLSSPITHEPIKNLKTFFTRLINACRKMDDYDCTTVKTSFNIFNFSMSYDDKVKMFIEGRDQNIISSQVNQSQYTL
jgi:predicted acylesterase/phospholipase RssA